MSKEKFSEEDTIELCLLKKGNRHGGTWWEFTTLTPSWVHKYLFQHGIKDLDHNPLTSKVCADWLRSNYPEEALVFGLANKIKFKRAVRAVGMAYELERTEVQYRDSEDKLWIRLMQTRCPAAMIEYVVGRYPQCIDEVRGRVRSEIFMSEEFSKWVCRRDPKLASLLGLGVRQAIRLADEADD